MKERDGFVEIIYKNDQMIVFRQTLAPGEVRSWHYHTHVSDMFYVVKGPIRIITKDPSRSVDLNAGDTFRVGPKSPHTILNKAGNGEVEWILIQGLGECDYVEVGAPAGE